MSFEDTPESVIERLLDHAEGGGGEKHQLKSTSTILKDEGALLPESEYWIPILRILDEAGGGARSRDVIVALGERLDSKFTPRDWDILEMGEVRWQNRARFARLRMKEQGLVKKNSPRGIWEITDEGRRFLERGG